MGLRIRILPADGGAPVTICDSPEPMPSFNFTLNGRRALQVQDMFRANYVTVFPRQNKVNRISFEVVRKTDLNGREFSGPAAALLFAIDQQEAVPTTGTIEFFLTDGSANGTRWLKNGGIESLETLKYIGRTLFLRYNLVGGRIVKPNALPHVKGNLLPPLQHVKQ